MTSGVRGTEWISRPYGAYPALMGQVNYKQGPPAVLSNKTRQEGNCPELEHRGTQRARNTLATGRTTSQHFPFSMRPEEKPAGKRMQAPDGNSPESQKKEASRPPQLALQSSQRPRPAAYRPAVPMSTWALSELLFYCHNKVPRPKQLAKESTEGGFMVAEG